MRRQLEKHGKKAELEQMSFLPSTFVLPADYHQFLEEFRQHPKNTIWIMKPVAGAQGRGIFLFRRLKEIADWKKVQLEKKTGK